ncbi:MAG TPA: hypothetical protein DD723_01595 [Candidatus Omnitrophica bacterium]|nr:hypothetical protein [Candidatus Omnitrophota bacterium]
MGVRFPQGAPSSLKCLTLRVGLWLRLALPDSQSAFFIGPELNDTGLVQLKFKKGIVLIIFAMVGSIGMNQKSVQPNKTLKIVLLVIILLACWFLGRYLHIDLEKYQEILLKYPPVLSGVIFVVLYVGLTSLILFGPKDILRIGAAVLFGPYRSTVLVWIGELGNAFVLFHLSRKLGREYVEAKFGFRNQDPDKIKKESGFLEIMALRINPLVPFRFMDLGFGLSSIGFKKYFAAIFLTSLIRVFWLQYILAGVGGNVFKDPSVVMNYLMAHPFILVGSAVYFLAIFLMTMMVVIIKFNKKNRHREAPLS